MVNVEGWVVDGEGWGINWGGGRGGEWVGGGEGMHL